MNELGMIIIGSVFVNNIVLTKFLGLCPFFGVSKSTNTAFGMGIAVTFVMTIASVATWTIYNYVLIPGPSNLIGFIFPDVAKVGTVDILKIVSYILVIATLVQLVEMIIKKKSQILYKSLGVYLPLITTNCAILGTALLVTTNAPRPLSVLEATVQSFATGVGFTLALLLMSGIRERLENLDLPKPFRGLPIALISASLMSLAFMGFAGMQGK
jgi:electron transport complex protein RnfA